jgi:hypothetical protein
VILVFLFYDKHSRGPAVFLDEANGPPGGVRFNRLFEFQPVLVLRWAVSFTRAAAALIRCIAI